MEASPARRSRVGRSAVRGKPIERWSPLWQRIDDGQMRCAYGALSSIEVTSSRNLYVWASVP